MSINKSHLLWWLLLNILSSYLLANFLSFGKGGQWGREFELTLTQKKKGYQTISFLFCGMDETRTRDPLRDRQVF